jgi:zinc D-Ala-D-Ala carboxypeptidase
MARERLSEHFWLDELLVSSAADERGIANDPEAAHLANLRGHLAPGLEHVRGLIGSKPIVVLSAYRNPEVNRLVGGTATSAHPQGFAADIRAAGLSSLELARRIAAAMAAKALRVDQMIWESGRNVVHVSFDPRARMMAGRQPAGPGTPINWRYFQ